MTDPIVESVIEDLRKRSEVGIKKYNTTLAREDLTLSEWVQHALEESMDRTLYLKRVKVELDKKCGWSITTGVPRPIKTSCGKIFTHVPDHLRFCPSCGKQIEYTNGHKERDHRTTSTEQAH